LAALAPSAISPRFVNLDGKIHFQDAKRSANSVPVLEEAGMPAMLHIGKQSKVCTKEKNAGDPREVAAG
jgi:hypothetical protein